MKVQEIPYMSDFFTKKDIINEEFIPGEQTVNSMFYLINNNYYYYEKKIHCFKPK